MKKKIKFDGNLGLYLHFPLYLGLFLIAVNIGVYIYDIKSGMGVSAFLFIYMGFALLLYIRAKKEFVNWIQ